MRVKNRGELVQIIEKAMIGKSNREWDLELEGAKFPYGPVNRLSEVFQDPQVLHNQMVRKMEHDFIGEIKQVKYPCFNESVRERFSDVAPEVAQILHKRWWYLCFLGGSL